MCAAIALKLCTWHFIYDLQIKFEDCCCRPIFGRVMPLERIISFPDFFLTTYRYLFNIWYIALPYQDTDQVLVWFQSIDLSQSYGPWRKISGIISFPDFLAHLS
jgi:hypothetical protein